MKTRPIIALAGVFALSFLVQSCKHSSTDSAPAPSADGYPAEISQIFSNKCATSGCHNAASYEVSGGGLRLDAWEHLFKGGNTGAAIVPYSLNNSALLYFTNVSEELGPMPPDNMRMPYNGASLTREEYTLLRNWVMNGAPDAQGKIAFETNAPTRQKIYLTMQGCDLLAVIDAESKVVMRYIEIGKTPAIENPHCVKVSPDGRFAYVSFVGGEYVQKISTETDKVVAELYVGQGSWNVFVLSPDGKEMLLSDWRAQPQGRLLRINTETMSVIQEYGGQFQYPHGIASNADFSVFYITAQYGNVVYKLTTSPVGLKQITIDAASPIFNAGARDPHEILMSPDYSKYFLTCEHSNEVRVMDAIGDTLLKVIPVGKMPQEMAISKTRPYVFVTCMEDDAEGNYKGSVYAVNYNTYEAVRIDGPFFQPHGIAVDDQNGLLFVASRNVSEDGPPPHHVASCAGRNGYYLVYDLHTFQRLPRRYEVSVEPYSADSRFK